jgi:hypothetical protein
MDFGKLEISKQKEYCSVKSYYDYKLDISIFEIKEWEHLLEISKKFEQYVHEEKIQSDDNYKELEVKKSEVVYYLYYNPYESRGLSNVEYYYEYPYEIYETIYQEIKKDDGITIDGLRNWIKDNYKELIDNYNKLI